MKLIANSGNQRAIDELRPYLARGAAFDIASSDFSLNRNGFGFGGA